MSDFYCTRCGRYGIPIPRKGGREREGGHLKKLWCIYCKEEINHVECRPYSHYTYEDFLFEKENNNFDENGNRKLPISEFRAEMNRKGLM